MKTFILSMHFALVILFTSTLGISQTITLHEQWVKKTTSIYGIKFTPDAAKLVTGGVRKDNNSYGQIKVSQVSNGAVIDSVTNANMGVTDAIDVSKNGGTILSGNGSIQCGGEGNCVPVLPGFFQYTITGRQLKFSNDSSQPVPAIVFSPDNTRIAVGTNYNNTGNIRIFDSTFRLIRELQNHSTASVSLKFTPDGKYLVSGNDSNNHGTVKIWNYKTGQLVHSIINGDYVTGGGASPQVDVSPDGKYIAAGGNGYNMAVRIFNVANGALVRTLSINSGDYYGNSIPLFTPDGKYVVAGTGIYGANGVGWHAEIYVWRVSDGALVKKIIDNDGAPQLGGIHAIAISPTKNYLSYSVFDELKMFTYGIGGSATAETSTDVLQANALSFHTTVFPNPATTSATIRYSLPSTQNVSLLVYNVEGRKIAELVNGQKAAGTYKVVFNTAQLKAGVYIYKLITANGSETGKIVVSR